MECSPAIYTNSLKILAISAVFDQARRRLLRLRVKEQRNSHKILQISVISAVFNQACYRFLRLRVKEQRNAHEILQISVISAVFV